MTNRLGATERFVIYLTKRDKKAIYAAAKAHGEHASDFGRRVLLSHIAEDATRDKRLTTTATKPFPVSP